MAIKFKELEAIKGKLSASEYNMLTRHVEGLVNSGLSNGFLDSNGCFLTRNVAPNTVAVIRQAYCKADAGSAATIDCYLDTNGTGDEVTVTCSIAGGTLLNSAIPRLEAGDVIFVTKIIDTWHCLTTFQASESCDCYTDA